MAAFEMMIRQCFTATGPSANFSQGIWAVILTLFLLTSCGIAKAESPAHSTAPLVFSSVEGSRIDNFIFNDVLKEAYRRIGIEIRREVFPIGRSLLSSNTGKTDGEMGRVMGISDKFTNLVIVPVAVMHTAIEAFSLKERDISIENGWPDLAPHAVATLRGILIIERNADRHRLRYSRLETSEQLFRTLLKGRYDVVITDRTKAMDALGVLKREGSAIGRIRRLVPPLLPIKLYHYLHRRHRQLIPRIEASLKEMEREGLIRKRLEKMLTPR